MREYKYREKEVPQYLLNQTDMDNLRYKNDTVKEALLEIFDHKCVYCESKFESSYDEIEHYRPTKSNPTDKCNATYSYGWLKASWDNLLISCRKCNSSKGNCFDIDGERANFDEDKTDFHKTQEEYNKKEKPKLLHPEINKSEEGFEDKIIVDKKGNFFSNDTQDNRIEYTIRICELNRTPLLEARESIINNYKEDIRTNLYNYYEANINIQNEKSENAIYYALKQSFDNIILNADKKEKYSFVSLYIDKNFDDFIECTNGLELDDKMIIKQCWTKHKEAII